jgi:hypothetical protein
MICCGGSCVRGSPLFQTSTSNVKSSIAINLEASCWRYTVLRDAASRSTCNVQCAVCNRPVCAIEAKEFGGSWTDVCVLNSLSLHKKQRRIRTMIRLCSQLCSGRGECTCSRPFMVRDTECAVVTRGIGGAGTRDDIASSLARR